MQYLHDHLAKNTPAGGVSTAARAGLLPCENISTIPQNGVACALWINLGGSA